MTDYWTILICQIRAGNTLSLQPTELSHPLTTNTLTARIKQSNDSGAFYTSCLPLPTSASMSLAFRTHKASAVRNQLCHTYESHSCRLYPQYYDLCPRPIKLKALAQKIVDWVKQGFHPTLRRQFKQAEMKFYRDERTSNLPFSLIIELKLTIKLACTSEPATAADYGDIVDRIDYMCRMLEASM